MPDALRVAVEVEVRYAETDAMGIVHHANYLVWFELARTRLCRESGTHYADIERSGYWLTVTGAEARYRSGARYGDTVRVASWVDRLESRGIRFGYEVHRDRQLIATGMTRHVWIDRNGRPRRLPEPLRGSFARLAGKDTTHDA